MSWQVSHGPQTVPWPRRFRPGTPGGSTDRTLSSRSMPLLLIGLGGFVGAIARYAVDGAVSDRTGGAFPWGTLFINATGSFVLGFLFALTAERAVLPAEIRGPLMIGFLGAYTT